MDPNAAIEAAPLAEAASFELEAPAGVVAVERARGITMAVEIETPPPHRRWRWFLSYLLLRLAARVYPFRLELYRTRRSWE
jgi:hypothetical protein